MSVRTWLRRLRRETVLGPVLDAVALRAVLARITAPGRHARVLGPDELAPYVRELTTLSPHLPLPADLAFDYIVVRQDHLNGFEPAFMDVLRDAYRPVYENRRFLLFVNVTLDSRTPSTARGTEDRLGALGRRPSTAPPRAALTTGGDDRAVLVTTFNRPAALERSLPQLAAFGVLILVVDDGSSERLAERNRAACLACGARYLPLPANRGLAAAMNVGMAYLLADRRLEWVSYAQDDVDVDPSLMDQLRKVEHPLERPLLTGYDADEHPAHGESNVAGVRITLKRSSPAVHLHAHRDYWQGVLPIPTEYIGAPRRRWEASLEDYWIVNNAPASAGQRGIAVACLPGLVRTFLWHHGDSTWDNPNQPDPSLGSAGGGG